MKTIFLWEIFTTAGRTFLNLTKNRTGLDISNGQSYNEALRELGAYNADKALKVTFGNGFDRITNIETGPDGLLYVLSYDSGRVYKITV